MISFSKSWELIQERLRQTVQQRSENDISSSVHPNIEDAYVTPNESEPIIDIYDQSNLSTFISSHDSAPYEHKPDLAIEELNLSNKSEKVSIASSTSTSLISIRQNDQIARLLSSLYNPENNIIPRTVELFPWSISTALAITNEPHNVNNWMPTADSSINIIEIVKESNDMMRSNHGISPDKPGNDMMIEDMPKKEYEDIRSLVSLRDVFTNVDESIRLECYACVEDLRNRVIMQEVMSNTEPTASANSITIPCDIVPVISQISVDTEEAEVSPTLSQPISVVSTVADSTQGQCNQANHPPIQVIKLYDDADVDENLSNFDIPSCSQDDSDGGESGQVEKEIKEISSDSDGEEDHIIHRVFESKLRDFWDNCKSGIERIAEKRAKTLVRSWKRDMLTLDDAIETTLKEYGDMYEKAIAVKEMFEYEKMKWKDEVLGTLSRNTPANHVQGYGSPFDYYGDNNAPRESIDDLQDDNLSLSATNLRKRSLNEDGVYDFQDNDSFPSSRSNPSKRKKFKIPTMHGT